MLLKLCLVAVSGFMLMAQTPQTLPRTAQKRILIVPAMQDAPFSATAVFETTEHLPSGTAQKTTSTSFIARDSAGRVRRDNRNPQGQLTSSTISDPVLSRRILLNVVTREATILKMASVGGPRWQPNVNNSEDLGVVTMEGLTVRGWRRADPPAPDAKYLSEEAWFSEQLQLLVKAIYTARDGVVDTTTLTEVSLKEPDAAFFQYPADYRVIDAAPIKVAEAVAQSNLIEQVQPVYPALARSARVQGTVIFNVTIGTDGEVKATQLVKGHPLLVNAAKDAVMQWKYKPILLTGQPVEVLAPVTVTFTLAP